ncbi:MAG: hypothetical protein ABI581_08960 [Sediminibacterium sp.]
MNAESKQVLIAHISELKELAEKFSQYQNAPINLETLMYFLSQFETSENIRIMIGLLKKIDFLNSAKILALLKTAYYNLDSTLREKPIIASLGGPHDSSSMVCYGIIKELFPNEQEGMSAIRQLSEIGETIEKRSPSAIIFFDDNITSGTQLTQFFKEWIEGVDNPEIVNNPLSTKQYEKLKAIPIRICYCIQLTPEATNVVSQINDRYQLQLSISCGKYDFNNYTQFGHGPFDSEAESHYIQSFFKEIGEKLYDDKDWDHSTLYQRLMGYGNLGKLTVFYYNVPKSLLPVFWKSGEWKGKQWIPLFAEFQEKKKMELRKVIPDFFQLETVRNWIKEQPGSRFPHLSFGFLIDGKVVDTIFLSIPNRKMIEHFISEYFNIKPAKASVNNVSGPRFTGISGVDPGPTPLDDDSYSRYTSAIDRYNGLLTEYISEVHQYILRFSTRRFITLAIENTGTAAATHCSAFLTYTTANLIFGDAIDDFQKPLFAGQLPDISTYRKGQFTVSRRQDFNMTNIIGDLFGHKPVEPLRPGTEYTEDVLKGRRVGHNETVKHPLKIFRVSETNEILMGYQINYEENPDPLSGVITIRYKETTDVVGEMKEEMEKLLDKFGQPFERKPRRPVNFGGWKEDENI